jgi:hypothetical protein
MRHCQEAKSTGARSPAACQRGWHIGLAVVVAAVVGGCGRAPSLESPEYASREQRGASADNPASASVPESPSVEPSSALTDAQLALKRKLEAQLAEERSTHRLVLRNGRTVTGRVIGETATSVRLREGFGFSGYVISSYKREEIAMIEALSEASFEVTAADVRLCQEFPEYNFAKSPPYAFVTDESFSDVEKILGLLGALRRQFEERFAPLIRAGSEPREIQIIFFAKESAFRAYAQRVAPAFVNSAGFYSTHDNCLALLDQFGSGQYARIQDKIRQRQQALDQRERDGAGSQSEAARRLAATQGQLTSLAKAMTERLIRHEGAHQLFHTYHIQSPYGVEPTWLYEGMAGYCEPEEVGRYHYVLAERVAAYRKAGQLLPLRTLLNYRAASGFFALGPGQAEIAYAQGWSVVYFLMQDPYRRGFFEFIKSYSDLKNPPAAKEILRRDTVKSLESFLTVDFATIESQWQEFVSHM